MRIRDVLMSKEFVFGLLVVISLQWMYQIFTGKSTSPAQPVAGQMIKAPLAEQIAKPITTEVDFYDVTPENYKTVQTKIDTKNLQVILENQGATITQIYIKRIINGAEQLIPLLAPISGLPREGRAFLVACEEKTPYYYTFVEQDTKINSKELSYETETDEGIENSGKMDTQEVMYRAETDEIIITKKYTFYDTTCKIDLTLTIEPRNGKTIQNRIFLPAPLIKYISPHDSIRGIFLDEYQKVAKKKPAELEGMLWIPQKQELLFGSEDRYFINALVTDPQKFVQRAYYRLEGIQHITAIVEGPPLNEPKTWTLSFYCGPKQTENMVAVDPILEQTLEYGWLAMISKGLLLILKWIYKWVHNYGWAIIILTLLMRLLLLPFVNTKKSKGMANRLEMQKKLQYVEQKYKHDPEILAQERKKIYDKYNVIPEFSEIGGCLPALLQIPLFLGLNRVLSNAIELYKAPFINGWIDDLSAKDPYYILPTIIGISMIFVLAGKGDIRKRFMMSFVAIVIAAFFASFPAGLSLYFCVTFIVSAIQSQFQRK